MKKARKSYAPSAVLSAGFVLGGAFLLLAALPAAAAELAIRGYDPVSYHIATPSEGSEQFTYDWNGMQWRFASSLNRDLFATNPQRYAPQYNGFCAYAAAKNYLAEIDPVRGWTLLDGKLYMNWSASVKYLWRQRAKSYVSQADENWPGLLRRVQSGRADISRKR